MTHFGFAFGVITASVLGGAFLVDHHLKNSPETTTRTTTTTTVAEAPVSPAVDDATKVADAGATAAIQPRIESAVTMPEPPKAAKAPARGVTSRNTTMPSAPEVQPSPPAEATPSTSEAPGATPSPEPVEKPEPQPAPARGPEG